jgi:hypothetical protein
VAAYSSTSTNSTGSGTTSETPFFCSCLCLRLLPLCTAAAHELTRWH